MPAHPSGRRTRRGRRVLASLSVATVAVGALAVGVTASAGAVDRLVNGNMSALDSQGLSTGGATNLTDNGPGSAGMPYAAPPLGTDQPGGEQHGGDPFRTDPFTGDPPTQQGAAATDTSEATDQQSAGLAMINTVIDYGTGKAAGTGMVLTDDGYVVTNHHVVKGATQIEVTIPQTGQTYEATYVGGSAERDVAVLHLVGASELTTIDVDGSGVSVGDQVVSVGDAGGDGGSFTAAPGTVTRTDTDITVSNEDGSESNLTNLVEVTSDIERGDSGGALLDQDGEVAGMNVAATSGGSDINGYVIPMARVMNIVEQIMSGTDSGGIVLGTNGFLGVTLSNDTSPVVAGVVAGSPAESAGLAAGDTVTAVDGQAVTSTTALQEAITSHASGDSVRVQWTDPAGTSHSADVQLDSAPVA